MILIAKIAAILLIMAFLHMYNMHLGRPRKFKNTNQELIDRIDSLATEYYQQQQQLK